MEMEPLASHDHPPDVDKEEDRPDSSKSKDRTCPPPQVALKVVGENSEEAPWRTLWERSSSTSRFLALRGLLPEAKCKKCKNADKTWGKAEDVDSFVKDHSWSLDAEKSRTCWQCLIVLTVSEVILGRPLSADDKIGVCIPGALERRRSEVNDIERRLCIQRLHLKSRSDESIHKVYSVYSCSDEVLIPFPPPSSSPQEYLESDFTVFASHSYEIASIWLKRCLTDHPTCRSQEETQLPRRVIFVGNGIGDIHLVVNNKSTMGRYTCLSHCWGTKQLLTTTKSNIESHRRSIEWERLPKTFQDAIKVTQHLGVDYMWIDSLCIVQDDTHDWAEEASKMCDIYENSYLTIAATSAFDSSQGLSIREHANFVRLRGSTSSNIPFDLVGYCPPHINEYNNHTAGHPSAHLPVTENPPLYTRAWVYQERMLSPRILHFCKEELMWECRTMSFCECRPEHSGGTYASSGGTVKQHCYRALNGGSSGDVLRDWYFLVREYSALNLTYQSDKLPALSGLAKHHWRMRPSVRYLAGLWSNTLMADLLWTCHYPEASRFERSPETWRAPSWSWAAHNFVVRFPESGGGMCDGLIRILHCETTLATSDPTGQVSAGSLIVAGWLYDAHISRTFQEYGKNVRKGTLTLAIKATGAKIQSIFKLFEDGRYSIRGTRPTEIVTMDSLHELFWVGDDANGKDDYPGSDIKCLRWTQMQYPDLLKEDGTHRWEEDPNAEEVGEGGVQVEDNDWLREIGTYKEAMAKSSVEYALILQRIEGDRTYRRIGMLIQYRSVGRHEPARPLPKLWEDELSALDSGGTLDLIKIV